MSITADVLELKQLDIEIKRVSKQLSTLKTHKIACEKRILEYLEVNDQPGLKMDGTIIVAQDRRRRKYQKKSEKQARGQYILEKHGIYNSKETLDEILEALRGSPDNTRSLKIY